MSESIVRAARRAYRALLEPGDLSPPSAQRLILRRLAEELAVERGLPPPRPGLARPDLFADDGWEEETPSPPAPLPVRAGYPLAGGRGVGSVLTPRVLADVYAALLASASPRIRRLGGAPEAEKTRRARGHYPTPDALIDRVLDQVGAPPGTPWPALCDPAVGGGAFLLRALERGAGPLPAAERRAWAAATLHGLDRDPLAVAVARAALWLAVATPARPEPLELPGLQVADTLRGDRAQWAARFPAVFARDGGFGLIVGNPPYLGFKHPARRADSALAAWLRAHYRVHHQHADLWYYFVEQAIRELARPADWRLGLVVPRYFQRAPGAARLRALLAPYAPRFSEQGGDDGFAGARVHVGILLAAGAALTPRPPLPPAGEGEKESPLSHHNGRGAGGEGRPGLGGEGPALLPLARLATVCAGAQTGADGLFVQGVERAGERAWATRDGQTWPLEADLVRPWLKNGRIARYQATAAAWCLTVPEGLTADQVARRYPAAWAYLARHEARLRDRRSTLKRLDDGNWWEWMRTTPAHLAPAKLVLPYRAPFNRAALDRAGAWGSIDVTVVVPWKIDPDYLLALLNSRWLGAWHAARAKELAPGVYDYYPRTVGAWPIPHPAESTPAAQRAALVQTGLCLLRCAPEKLAAFAAAQETDVLRDLLAILARRLRRLAAPAPAERVAARFAALDAAAETLVAALYSAAGASLPLPAARVADSAAWPPG